MEILREFVMSPKPLTVIEIQKRLNDRQQIFNKTTLYREIETLEKAGVIHALFLQQNQALYEIVSHHHHHFTCIVCGDIRHIEVSEDCTWQGEKIAKKERFQILNHSLEFFGRCQECCLHEKIIN
jgi:Fe2+ or Zn2+ uptake regulation protein